MRRLALLAAVLGGFASSASAYTPEMGEFRITDQGPYTYLFNGRPPAMTQMQTPPCEEPAGRAHSVCRATAAGHGDLYWEEPSAQR